MIYHLPLFLQLKPKTMEMDVRHYFDPVSFTKFSELNASGWKYSMGELIEKSTGMVSLDKLQKLDLVILGVPFDSRRSEANSSDAPDKIREEFYYLAKTDHKLNIADFGNLKPANSIKGNYQALRDIVEYFGEFKIPVIVIGGSQDLSYGICEAFKSNLFFTYSTIDAFLNIKKTKESLNSSNYLSRIFSSNPNLFQFSLIAYQSHFIASEYFSKTKGISNHLRLGQLRDDISQAEPILRNSDVLSFDIGAIKYSEAPAGCSLTPNGLRSEEACQLAKYAGLSERLKVFGLFEVDPEKDQYELTTKLSAQILWYYIEGLINRQVNGAGLEENRIIYQVDVEDVSKPLVFCKNTLTNQWWMQFQAYKDEPITLACSEEEYRQAANNDIPDLWLKYIQKIDEILK
jgi:formiminoglutamase